MVKPAFLTLFWQYFGSSKKYIHNSVVFISKESYAQWNFSLNYPCIRGNLRIHCFPGSLLMFKCCFALYSELFSCLDYFSLVTGEKLILNLWFKTRSDVSNTCCYLSHLKQPPALLLWEHQTQSRGDFRHWSFAAVLPVRSLSDLIAPTDSNLLASHSKLPVTNVMPRTNIELIRWHPSQCLLPKGVQCSPGFSNPPWAASSSTCNMQR